VHAAAAAGGIKVPAPGDGIRLAGDKIRRAQDKNSSNRGPRHLRRAV